MNHAPEYLQTMRALADLIRDVRMYSVWQFDFLCDWFSYFWNRGTFSYVLDKDGNAQAVCAIKLFRHLEGFLEPFIHEPDGDFCMIVLLSGRDTESLMACNAELTRRFGGPRTMLWDRGERTENGAPRMFSWIDYQKLVARMRKGPVMMNGRSNNKKGAVNLLAAEVLPNHR